MLLLVIEDNSGQNVPLIIDLTLNVFFVKPLVFGWSEFSIVYRSGIVCNMHVTYCVCYLCSRSLKCMVKQLSFSFKLIAFRIMLVSEL